MTKAFEDPLLRFARLVLSVLLAMSALTVVAVLIAIPIILVRQQAYTAELVSEGFDPSTLGWGQVLLVLIAAVMALVFVFLRELRAIVASVSQGDAFIPVNADRLQRMAWLTLPIQALMIPLTRLSVWFDAAPQAPNVHHGTDGISIAGLLVTLTLFVLARVFREGTRLREDIEGTV